MSQAFGKPRRLRAFRLELALTGLAALAGTGCQNALSRRWAWPDAPEAEPRAARVETSKTRKVVDPPREVADLPDLQKTPAAATPSKVASPRPAEASGTPILDAAVARSQAAAPAVAETPAGVTAPLRPTTQGLATRKDDTAETLPVLLPVPSQAEPPKAGESPARTDPAVVPVSASEDAPALTELPGPRPVELAAELPEDAWRAGVERLRTLARKRATTPDEDDPLWPVRARVVDWLAGDDAKPETWQTWTSVLAALASTDLNHVGDEPMVAETFDEAVTGLDALIPLHVTDLQFCGKVHGFGQVDLLDTGSLKAGQAVIVYCEVAGLRWRREGEGFRSRVSSRVEIVKHGETKPVWSQDRGAADDLCRRRRRDYYVNYRVSLPKSLAPGPYDLRLTQTDLVGERSTSATLGFAVRP